MPDEEEKAEGTKTQRYMTAQGVLGKAHGNTDRSAGTRGSGPRRPHEKSWLHSADLFK